MFPSNSFEEAVANDELKAQDLERFSTLVTASLFEELFKPRLTCYAKDVIKLQFKTQEFKVQGVALAELFVAFQTFSVFWRKECPDRYQILAPKSQAIIEETDVKNQEIRHTSALDNVCKSAPESDG